jgi:hypothetical protein
MENDGKLDHLDISFVYLHKDGVMEKRNWRKYERTQQRWDLK